MGRVGLAETLVPTGPLPWVIFSGEIKKQPLPTVITIDLVRSTHSGVCYDRKSQVRAITTPNNLRAVMCNRPSAQFRRNIYHGPWTHAVPGDQGP